MDKIIKRMQKGREEAEFKRRMTERSNFAITGSIKNAKKKVKTGVPSSNVNSMFTGDNKGGKFRGFGGVDSAQIKYNKKQTGLTKEREPLYLPRTQPKLSEFTLDMVQKEKEDFSFKPKTNVSKNKKNLKHIESRNKDEFSSPTRSDVMMQLTN